MIVNKMSANDEMYILLALHGFGFGKIFSTAEHLCKFFTSIGNQASLEPSCADNNVIFVFFLLELSSA